MRNLANAAADTGKVHFLNPVPAAPAASSVPIEKLWPAAEARRQAPEPAAPTGEDVRAGEYVILALDRRYEGAELVGKAPDAPTAASRAARLRMDDNRFAAIARIDRIIMAGAGGRRTQLYAPALPAVRPAEPAAPPPIMQGYDHFLTFCAGFATAATLFAMTLIIGLVR